MTTIITDGKTVASDSLQVGQFIDQISAIKIYRIGQRIVACAGQQVAAAKFVSWKQGDGEKPTFDDEEDFEAIEISGGRVWHYDKGLVPIEVGFPTAIGSGADYAMGAVLSGASPKQAVEVAKKLDPRTGGRIRLVVIK